MVADIVLVGIRHTDKDVTSIKHTYKDKTTTYSTYVLLSASLHKVK